MGRESSDDSDDDEEGATPSRTSQAKLDVSEEEMDEFDEDEYEDNKPSPPIAKRFDDPQEFIPDADEVEELAKESSSHQYKGYLEFLCSDRWRQMRNQVISDAGGLCQRCIARDKREPATQVHHERYVVPLDEQSLEDLEALCGPCHTARHQEMRAMEFGSPLRTAVKIADILAKDLASDDD